MGLVIDVISSGSKVASLDCIAHLHGCAVRNLVPVTLSNREVSPLHEISKLAIISYVAILPTSYMADRIGLFL